MNAKAGEPTWQSKIKNRKSLIPIYLDYNATTPIDPAVIEAMLPYLREHFGNPSSTHVYGNTAHEAVERPRQQVAELPGAPPDVIVVPSRVTDASNHAVGALQPTRAIAAIARERRVLLHTDAAQSLGKLPVDVNDLGVDMLSVAGHKLYAPKGIGALYIRKGVKLEPLIHGAGHES